MQFNNLVLFMSERSFLQTTDVTMLKGNKLGIDGNHWLREILIKEPATVAMGGIPLTLRSTIEEELLHFKEHSIQPVFVFPGLEVLRKDSNFPNKDDHSKDRANGWAKYDEGRLDNALEYWKKNGGVPPASLHKLVFRILHENNVEFMRAPYWSWAQLAYMYKEQLVHTVYGGPELLMWDIDKLITSFDFQKKVHRYRWVNKSQMLDNLKTTKDPNPKVTKDQFLDICILTGFEHWSGFPFSAFKGNQYPGIPAAGDFRGIMDFVALFPNGCEAIRWLSTFQPMSSSIAEFCRIRCAIKNHIVMTTEGKAKPLDDGDIPGDLHDVIGCRVPDELYYYLMRGLIGPQCINYLISGTLIEYAPLDNGETQEYQSFLEQLIFIRTLTLSLLAQPLHDHFHRRTVKSRFWFDREKDITMLYHPAQCNGEKEFVNNVYESIKWNAPKALLEKEKKAQNTSLIDIRFCMKAVEKNDLASETVSEPSVEQPLEGKDEIVATVLWKSLEIRDFLTSKHRHTPTWGAAFAAALNAAQKSSDLAKDPVVQDALLTAFELIRFNVLTGVPYSKTYSAPSGNEKEKCHITLLSRTLSLLPMGLKATPWKGPFNRDLLVFNSFANALNHSYRNLYEMITLSLFLNGLVKKERDDYFEISNSLPYISDGNVALGLVTMHYLEKSLTGSVAKALEATEEEFQSCSSLKTDLSKGFQFWSALMAGINVLCVEKKSETFAMFTEADQWLQSRRF